MTTKQRIKETMKEIREKQKQLNLIARSMKKIGTIRYKSLTELQEDFKRVSNELNALQNEVLKLKGYGDLIS
jgi:hypothetical protein